jgi:Zn-dependent protease with chaperone function
VIEIPKGSPAGAEAPAPAQGTGPPKGSSRAAAEKKPDPAQLQRQVLAAFEGEIKPVKVPVTYRFGILLVAVLMVILPLLYVGLVLATGYAMYYHAVHHLSLFESGSFRGRAAIVPVIAYVGPLVAGAILLLFMIKPLFARPAKQGRTRWLTRKSDALLFAFVDQVCGVVRSPKPRRIDVDCQVNASAGFRRGLLSMLGNDLVLTVGMPLAAGLNLRQFAGVLAHEFGHFSQGAGMRLTYVIRSVSYWFTRVVYERDQWDERLIQWSKESDWRIAIVLYVSRFFVWLTRGILWVLMMIGHVVSGFMLRQMEFDADRSEARLAGSDTFESTARRLVVLNVANQGAEADLGSFYQEGRLGDNLPRLIMANVERIPPEVHKHIDQMIDESTTGVFDTHPADKDRIASARRENARGVFRLEMPASVLFSGFEELSRNVTWDFYRAIFGPQFKPSDMHSTDDLLARQGKEQEAEKALARYFQGSFNTLRPIPILNELVGPPDDAKRCAERVKAKRSEMLDLKPKRDEAFAAFDEADTHGLEADQASAMFQAGFKVGPDAFSLQLTSPAAAARTRRLAGERREQVRADLDAFEEAATARLSGALELLHVPKVAARVPKAEEKQRQCARILPALRSLNETAHLLLQLRNEHAALGILGGNLEGNEENEHLIGAIRKKMDAVSKTVEELRRRLKTVLYPLDHAKGKISVGEYMLSELPPADHLGAVFDAGGTALETLSTLYVRLFARLAEIAEEVEEVLGLERLPELPEEENASETAGEAAGE